MDIADPGSFERLPSGGRRVSVRARLEPGILGEQDALQFSIGDAVIHFKPLELFDKGLKLQPLGVYELSGYLSLDKRWIHGMRQTDARFIRSAFFSPLSPGVIAALVAALALGGGAGCLVKTPRLTPSP